LGGPYETDLMDSPLVKFEVEHFFYVFNKFIAFYGGAFETHLMNLPT